MCEKVIYVVGIGPGKIEKMTREAFDVLKSSDIIVGYICDLAGHVFV